MTENVETYRRAHDAFNRRDWDGVIAAFAPDAQYSDQPRSLVMKSAQEFVG